MDQKLAARVLAVNKANEYARTLSVKLIDVFTPLVGQKITKASGQVMEKYAKLLPEFPHTVPLIVYKHVSSHSLAWTVKTCEMIGDTHGCTYCEVTAYIGTMCNGFLVGIGNPFVGRTDYTVEAVMAARAAHMAAKKVSDAAQSALYPFGEHDNC